MTYPSPLSASQSGQDFTARLVSSLSCTLDVDNNGLIEAQIDGQAIIRHLFGISPASSAVMSGPCAQRVTASEQASFLASQNFDFDGGGLSPAREGLVLLRLMLGVPGTQAVIGTGYSWSAIQSQINSACGTAF
ncbi:MAG: hypothetical protein ACK4XK_04170 [Casimicrobiaceae bacterium]